jgi:nucleotide-binding universal stress UspA family protein
MSSQQTVVVGVDGSDNSRAAARYAIADAARRGAQVVAVRAFEMPDDVWDATYQLVVTPSPSEVTINVEARTRAMLQDMAEELGGAARTVPVDAVAVLGSPAKVLLHQARYADLLIVGHRGRGELTSRVLGSVGLHCVLHATCPVTVVPMAPVAEAVDQPVTEPAADAVPARA